jgi:hypothetical protein
MDGSSRDIIYDTTPEFPYLSIYIYKSECVCVCVSVCLSVCSRLTL